MACLLRVCAVLARCQVELGTAFVISQGQGFLGRFVVELRNFCRVFWHQLAAQCQGFFGGVELAGQGCQTHDALARPVFLCQHADVFAQGLVLGHALVGELGRLALVLVVEQLPQGPQGVAAQLGVIRLQGRLQSGARACCFAVGNLALRQQQAQLGVVRITAQQVVQISDGECRFTTAGQAFFQVLAWVQQPQRQADDDHHRQNLPSRRQLWALSARCSGPGRERWHRGA